MHKKKVLFMINSMYGGGAEKIFQTLLNNLEPSKYDITVYSVNQCKIDHKYYPENINIFLVESMRAQDKFQRLLRR